MAHKKTLSPLKQGKQGLMALAKAYPPQVTEGVVTKYVWAGLLAYGSAFSRLPKESSSVAC